MEAGAEPLAKASVSAEAAPAAPEPAEPAEPVEPAEPAEPAEPEPAEAEPAEPEPEVEPAESPAAAAERARIEALPTRALKAKLAARGLSAVGLSERREFIEVLLAAPQTTPAPPMAAPTPPALPTAAPTPPAPPIAAPTPPAPPATAPTTPLSSRGHTATSSVFPARLLASEEDAFSFLVRKRVLELAGTVDRYGEAQLARHYFELEEYFGPMELDALLASISTAYSADIEKLAQLLSLDEEGASEDAAPRIGSDQKLAPPVAGSTARGHEDHPDASLIPRGLTEVETHCFLQLVMNRTAQLLGVTLPDAESSAFRLSLESRFGREKVQAAFSRVSTTYNADIEAKARRDSSEARRDARSDIDKRDKRSDSSFIFAAMASFSDLAYDVDAAAHTAGHATPERVIIHIFVSNDPGFGHVVQRNLRYRKLTIDGRDLCLCFILDVMVPKLVARQCQGPVTDVVTKARREFCARFGSGLLKRMGLLDVRPLKSEQVLVPTLLPYMDVDTNVVKDLELTFKPVLVLQAKLREDFGGHAVFVNVLEGAGFAENSVTPIAFRARPLQPPELLVISQRGLAYAVDLAVPPRILSHLLKGATQDDFRVYAAAFVDGELLRLLPGPQKAPTKTGSLWRLPDGVFISRYRGTQNYVGSLPERMMLLESRENLGFVKQTEAKVPVKMQPGRVLVGNLLPEVQSELPTLRIIINLLHAQCSDPRWIGSTGDSLRLDSESKEELHIVLHFLCASELVIESLLKPTPEGDRDLIVRIVKLADPKVAAYLNAKVESSSGGGAFTLVLDMDSFELLPLVKGKDETRYFGLDSERPKESSGPRSLFDAEVIRSARERAKERAEIAKERAAAKSTASAEQETSEAAKRRRREVVEAARKEKADQEAKVLAEAAARLAAHEARMAALKSRPRNADGTELRVPTSMRWTMRLASSGRDVPFTFGPSADEGNAEAAARARALSAAASAASPPSVTSVAPLTVTLHLGLPEVGDIPEADRLQWLQRCAVVGAAPTQAFEFESAPQVDEFEPDNTFVLSTRELLPVVVDPSQPVRRLSARDASTGVRKLSVTFQVLGPARAQEATAAARRAAAEAQRRAVYEAERERERLHQEEIVAAAAAASARAEATRVETEKLGRLRGHGALDWTSADELCRNRGEPHVSWRQSGRVVVLIAHVAGIVSDTVRVESFPLPLARDGATCDLRVSFDARADGAGTEPRPFCFAVELYGPVELPLAGCGNDDFFELFRPPRPDELFVAAESRWTVTHGGLCLVLAKQSDRIRCRRQGGMSMGGASHWPTLDREKPGELCRGCAHREGPSAEALEAERARLRAFEEGERERELAEEAADQPSNAAQSSEDCTRLAQQRREEQERPERSSRPPPPLSTSPSFDQDEPAFPLPMAAGEGAEGEGEWTSNEQPQGWRKGKW